MSRKPLLANVATMDGALTVAADMLLVDKATPKADTLRLVPLDALRPAPAQVRGMDATAPALLELADSLRVHGVLEPVLARRTAEGLELLAGHRRVAAARLVGLATVPVRILEDVDDATAAGITATENLAREDLAPWETMRAIATLRDAWRTAGKAVTVRPLAAAAGRSAGAVSEALATVDALTPAAAGADVQRLNALAWRDLVAASKAPDPGAALVLLVAPAVPLVADAGDPATEKRAGKRADKAAGKAAGRPRTWTVRLAPGDLVAGLTGADVATLSPTDAAAVLIILEPLVKALRRRMKDTP